MKDILWTVLKIICFVLILPLIIASVIAFQTQLLTLPVNKEVWLLWGSGVYIALNFFVYDFNDIFTFGNTQVERMLTFIKPAGYVVPVYSVILIIAYVIAWVLGRGTALQPYFLFAISFTLTMHMVLTAREIYQSDNAPFKAHYLITFGSVLVVSLFFISLLLAWVIPEFSFVAFIKSLASNTIHLYRSVYRSLFVDS